MKSKFFLTLALTVLCTQPLFAMEPPSPIGFGEPEQPTEPRQPWQTSWKKEVCAPENAFTNLPDELAILDNKSPLTDEMLLTNNPDWLYVTRFDQQTKNKILTEILRYPAVSNYGQHWYCMRSAIALMVCLGADPDRSYDSEALIWSTNEQDFPLTKYLLEKGANPNAQTNIKVLGENETISPLGLVRTFPLTELLVSHGARIDSKLFKHCCLPEYEAKVLDYYLTIAANHIAQNKKADSQSFTLLHHLAVDNKVSMNRDYMIEIRNMSDRPANYNQIEKVRLLLKAGFDPVCQDKRGNTPLHFVALRESGGLCVAFLTHYAIQLRKPFLQFLLCINRTHPKLKLPKDVRILIFQEFVCESMRTFLDIKNCYGETAHDIWNRGLKTHAGFARYFENKGLAKEAESYKKECEYHQAMVDLINPKAYTVAKIATAQNELGKIKRPVLVTPTTAGLHEPYYEDQWGC